MVIFKGTSIPIDRETPNTDPEYGRDLVHAFNDLYQRGKIERPPRPDPPVMQTPADYVLRYPTPPCMRAIKRRPLSQEGDPETAIIARDPPDYSEDIRPMIGSSIWPKRFDAVVPVPLTIRCQSIRGLEWGDEGIDKETRYKRHHGGNEKCRQRSLPNS